jgi:hypothetical protein
VVVGPVLRRRAALHADPIIELLSGLSGKVLGLLDDVLRKLLHGLDPPR